MDSDGTDIALISYVSAKSFWRARLCLVSSAVETVGSQILMEVSLPLGLDNANLEQVGVSNVRKYIDTSGEENELPSIVFEALQKLHDGQKVVMEDVNASNI